MPGRFIPRSMTIKVAVCDVPAELQAGSAEWRSATPSRGNDPTCSCSVRCRSGHGLALIVFERLVIAAGTLMMTIIALRTLTDPIGLTHPLGLALNTPTAITVVRVGFGGFPLGFAIALLSCLISTKRLLAGVSLVAALMAAILVARIQGLIVDGATAYNVARLPPEVAMLTLSLVAIVFERRRRHAALVVA